MRKSNLQDLKNIPRVVLDTNVLVSGCLNPNSPSGKILSLLTKPGLLEISISREILLEYSEVLHRKKFDLSKEKINYVLQIIFECALMVSPKRKLEITLDPDDNKFLECALEGSVNFIITGNKKHYPFSEFRGTKIVSPSEFLTIFKF